MTQRLTNFQQIVKPYAEIFAIRILGLDQCDAFRTSPSLDLPFFLSRSSKTWQPLQVNEAVELYLAVNSFG